MWKNSKDLQNNFKERLERDTQWHTMTQNDAKSHKATSKWEKKDLNETQNDNKKTHTKLQWSKKNMTIQNNCKDRLERDTEWPQRDKDNSQVKSNDHKDAKQQFTHAQQLQMM